MNENIKKTILLVEDEAIIAMSEKRQLEDYGYAIQTVDTGEDAVEAINTMPEIDLVLMDINLGGGIDGTEAAAIILASHDIPIVFVSSHSKREIVEKTEKITSYGYVVKNSSITVLDASIKMAFKLFEANQALKLNLKKDHESAQLLLNVMDNFPGIIFWKDKNSIFKGCSLAFARAAGLEHTKEIIGKSDYDMPWKDNDAEGFIKADRIVMDEGIAFTHIIETIHTKDNSVTWLDTSKIPLFDTEGIVNGILGVSLDVTHRIAEEESLRQSEERFNLAIECTEAGVWDWDMISDEVVYSARWKSMLGFAYDEVENAFSGWKDLWHPDDKEKIEKALYDYLTGKSRTYEIIHRCRHKNGEWRWILSRGDTIKNEKGKPVRWIGTNIDITEQKKAEEKQLQDAENLRQLNDSISAMLVLPDVRSSYEYMVSFFQNKYPGTIVVFFKIDEKNSDTEVMAIKGIENKILNMVLSLLSYNPIGKHFELMPRYNKLFRLAKFVSFNGKFTDLSSVDFPKWVAEKIENILSLDRIYTIGIVEKTDLLGAMLFLSFSKETLYDCDFIETFTRQAGVIIQKKMVDAKVQSLLQEKELILKEVHHRIKNNMATISSLLSLQAGTMTDPSSITALQDAENRIRSMSLLYEKLYRSTGFIELSVKDYLSSLLDEVVDNFPNSDKIIIEKDLQNFMLDAEHLQPLGIIVNELLTNTMKHAFKDRKTGLIKVVSRNDNRHITITIKDDGVGMPEYVTFDKFTGFGLQLVQALSEQLKGTVRIERGNGTKFILEFDV